MINKALELSATEEILQASINEILARNGFKQEVVYFMYNLIANEYLSINPADKIVPVVKPDGSVGYIIIPIKNPGFDIIFVSANTIVNLITVVITITNEL